LSFSRLDLLKRATALLVASRLNWPEWAFGATPNTVRQTLDALVGFIFPDHELRAATTPRLIRTLDRFLPGPVPLSATAATILNETAKQVRPGSTFAKLSDPDKGKVFETLERLPVESAGAIRFLIGNLPDLTAFLAYSTRRGWRLSRYSGVAHGHKEFRGYWHA
jgi:hypothetical protein